ncbi:MAG: NUDIX hydrolase [Gammaproteobacteria bacterium RIFCSPLOWO2_02_FULL_56_15]|nr:MAG: NUDIX hydrolase [Gammaproteobacteria bacterium RIFCSPLOWO2_02_FULL_56_15]
MQWKPNVTVAAVIFHNDQFLVVEERDNDRVVINQPAGHLERNESLLQAVQREVLEETAWEFEPQSITGIYLYPDPVKDITYLRVCFAGQAIRQHPNRKLDHGILRACWMSREELEESRERMRSAMVLRCFDDYLAGIAHPLELLNHHLI